MKVYVFEVKNEEELKQKINNELNVKKEDLLIKTTEKVTNNLFKIKRIKVEVLKLDDVINFSKRFLIEIMEKMGLKLELEHQKRDNYIKINMFSNNNGILIGKNGRTLDSLQQILRSCIINNTGFRCNLILDVQNYKSNQKRYLKRLAFKKASEVIENEMEIKLNAMKAYERKTIHEVLADNDKIITISEGEEPNRYVILKLKK
ncbi:MAG: protein jag [Bacilli bacterium]